MRRAPVAIALLAMIAGWQQSAAAHTLHGMVVDSAGAAIPDAHVWISIARMPRATTTDAAGHFSFADVPTESVQVLAIKDGYALGGASGHCIDDTEIQIALTAPASGRLRIINERYEAIEGARIVRLELPGVYSVYTQDLAALDFPAARSDAKGFLPLPPLPKGAFISISVGHPAYADGMLEALPTDSDIDFPLPDGVPLVGRIIDEAGTGVEHARVSIYRPRDDTSPLLATEALTSADGFYSTRVPPGKYFVAAHHPSFATPAPKAVLADELNEAVLNLTLPMGRRLHGRALDTTDTPVPRALFAYRKDEYIVAETLSDTNGLFEMLVPKGEGTLHVRPPRRMTTESPRLDLDVGEAPDVAIDTVRFRAAPELHGHVTARDDAPLNQVIITSLNLNPPVVATANAAGDFVLPLEQIPDEPLRFRAEHALRFLRREFEVDPAKLDASDVHLREYRPEPPEIGAYWPNDIKPLAGKLAPEVTCRAWLNLPEGQTTLRLGDLHGKVVVLFLWAGFDRSPRNLLRVAEMNAAYGIFKDLNDVAVVSVHDAAATPEILADYVRELGVTFPVGHDVDASTTFTAYRTGYVPQTLIIDKKGVLRFYTGEDKLLELVKLLRRE